MCRAADLPSIGVRTTKSGDENADVTLYARDPAALKLRMGVWFHPRILQQKLGNRLGLLLGRGTMIEGDNYLLR